MKKIWNEKDTSCEWGVIYRMMRRVSDRQKIGICVAVTEKEPRDAIAWKLRRARAELRQAVLEAA